MPWSPNPQSVEFSSPVQMEIGNFVEKLRITDLSYKSFFIIEFHINWWIWRYMRNKLAALWGIIKCIKENLFRSVKYEIWAILYFMIFKLPILNYKQQKSPH